MLPLSALLPFCPCENFGRPTLAIHNRNAYFLAKLVGAQNDFEYWHINRFGCVSLDDLLTGGEVEMPPGAPTLSKKTLTNSSGSKCKFVAITILEEKGSSNIASVDPFADFKEQETVDDWEILTWTFRARWQAHSEAAAGP
ncbi:hypothetical protein [Pelagibius sp. Alg239-R121]|uniref:hypothetical protein n=1 Tax=Pelagibius sp. Alg239-R121 TaxID=2993448 RepID=UPI0024A73F15|nr:hypothetical protein [Pelagibius sp. Alg239-R121]